jgi:tetratricopeptide (TPR) repeat protein
MLARPMAVEVFCSYAHEDKDWLDKLETHLSLLKRQKLLSIWHDRLIAPGADWATTIDTHLETASVILLLVSADFFASEYCFGLEMQRALARQEAGEARVIPILVRETDWQGAPFAHLQVLPSGAKPIASWQDKDAALADVVAEIRRAIVEELPLLAAHAPHTTFPAIWNIPYPRNPFFLGREKELAQIHQHLHTNQATALSQPQAISGLGGIGKTQLALEFAYRYHQKYQAVLWAFAESLETLISSYLTLASLLQLPEREAKEQEVIVQAVKHWLHTHHGWLLILDNADDLKLLYGFLPSSHQGHLLLTTRATVTGRLAHRLEIETLRPGHGALLLLRRAALLEPSADLMQAIQSEREQALAICQEMGGLPLALDQAGAYLEETGIDLASYQHLYQQHRAMLLEQRRGLVADHPSPVATTWSLSFHQVEQQNPVAAELLRLCAYLAPDAIAEEILTEGASQLGPVLAPALSDVWQRNQAIEALRTYSLVRRDPHERVLSIHRLVQAVLQDAFSAEEKRIWLERVIRAVNMAFPRTEYGTREQCERLLVQAVAAAQLINRHQFVSEEAESLLKKTADYLGDRARYAEAEPLYQHALRLCEERLSPEHFQVTHLLHALANLYYEQGKYAEAEPFYLRVLRIREEQLGSEHVQMASPLHDMANFYREQGKYGEAELLYQRALHTWEQTLGSEHPQVGHPLAGLAELYRQQGKDREAESLYQRALHIWEQKLGPEHIDVAFPLTGLAELYRQEGKDREAELLYQRALHIREQKLDLEHPAVAYQLIGLAKLYFKQGKGEEAVLLARRALAIREHSLGSEHYKTVEARGLLAQMLESPGSVFPTISRLQ